MTDCFSQYLAAVNACSAAYHAKIATCSTSECVQAAIAERNACEDKAWTDYLDCLGTGGGSSAPAQRGCGCD